MFNCGRLMIMSCLIVFIRIVAFLWFVIAIAISQCHKITFFAVLFGFFLEHPFIGVCVRLRFQQLLENNYVWVKWTESTLNKIESHLNMAAYLQFIYYIPCIRMSNLHVLYKDGWISKISFAKCAHRYGASMLQTIMICSNDIILQIDRTNRTRVGLDQ